MTDEPYDSAKDTQAHINEVAGNIAMICVSLRERGGRHDRSKLEEPEKSVFDEVTPKLRRMTYGSGEYKAQLHHMGKALDHHYQHNSHHPEFHDRGVRDMSLLDLLEMLADWYAAGKRHADGSLVKSLAHNLERFRIPPDLFLMLAKTALELGWIDQSEFDSLPAGY
jgi:hypothetical protein